MLEVSRLLGRKIDRADGPAEIVGAVLVQKFWEVGDHHPRGQHLQLILLTASCRLLVEDAHGLTVLLNAKDAEASLKDAPDIPLSEERIEEIVEVVTKDSRHSRDT